MRNLVDTLVVTNSGLFCVQQTDATLFHATGMHKGHEKALTSILQTWREPSSLGISETRRWREWSVRLPRPCVSESRGGGGELGRCWVIIGRKGREACGSAEFAAARSGVWYMCAGTEPRAGFDCSF